MRKAAIRKIEANLDFIYETNRNLIALIFMTNYKYKYIRIKNALMIITLGNILRIIYNTNSDFHKILLRSLIDGITLGFYLKRNINAINIKEIPYIRTVKLLRFILRLVSPLPTMSKREFIKEILVR